jgi:L-asparagine transporter-like permease
MANGVPIVIIVIGVILAVVALLAWRMQREGKLEGISNKRKKAFFAQFIIGLILALTAAFFMFDGDILGENTAGISTVMGIVGIGLIATSNVHLLPLRQK